MHSQDVKYTLFIFRVVYSKLPPLVPEEIRKELGHALDHLKSDYDITLSEAEETLVVFGKKIWPFWKAFEEMVNMHKGELGEKFFISKLPPKIKKKYSEFKEHGGEFKDFATGSPMSFFDDSDRQFLTSVLLEVDKDIRLHTRQEVLGIDKDRYQELIVEFGEVLDGIEKRLETLRTMADSEQEHPQLADEIRAQIKAFEHGICFLAPKINLDDINNSYEFFVERKQEKITLR
ncbi:MAG: hypothetical protein GF349_02630 [Candidatus Magasanikbacteria bacterium]|nr:hypothetical protein [Candidatus Magasanikbacteria bacterium]